MWYVKLQTCREDNLGVAASSLWEWPGDEANLTYLSVDPVIRTDLLNFRQVTGPVMKENAPRLSAGL